MNINDTITNAVGRDVARSYPRYVNAAVRAAEQRETRIKNGLRAIAQRRGLAANEVTALFREVGLEEAPRPAPTEQAATKQNLLTAVDALAQAIRAL